MVDRVATRFVGGTPRVEGPDIPLNPIAENYTGVRYWDQERWLEIRGGGHNSPDLDSPVWSLWMEDSFGDPVPQGVRTNIREDVFAYWNDMVTAKDIPKLYAEAGFEAKEAFRITMEGKYNWLRLCAGHWKVRQLWMNCYRGWKKSYLKALAAASNVAIPPTPVDQAGPEGSVVIEIISSDDDGRVGSKRRHEGDDLRARSSKKQKGKEVPKSNFHPTPPLAKKPKAKLARVSTSLFLLDAQLLRNA